MPRCFDWMQNYINDSVYECVRGLIFRNGGSIDDTLDYYDGELGSISDDYNFCFYLKVMDLPGFHEMIRERRLKIAYTEKGDYGPDIKGDFIVLRPIGKTTRAPKSLNRAYFDYALHLCDMLIIRPRKLRETISVCGMCPSTEYQLRTRHGFETDEPRIYIIIPERVGDGDKVRAEEVDDAIRWAVNEYNSRCGETEYDIWNAKITWDSDIRKDAAFNYGGYVVDAISPENLTLVNTIRYGEEQQNENIAKLKMTRN